MKKALLLVSILFISVISTACINNFAVQELNNNAKTFMDKGDYKSAIERLKSSVDLDGTVFETRYNLAVAYTKAEDYVNAIDAYNEVIKLNPDFADSYYSLAVCEENLAKDIISGNINVKEDGSIAKANEPAENSEPEEANMNDDNDKLSGSELKLVSTLLTNSISDYKIYLDKASQAEDKDEVAAKIEELEEMIKKYISLQPTKNVD